jgi:hypothetical protein
LAVDIKGEESSEDVISNPTPQKSTTDDLVKIINHAVLHEKVFYSADSRFIIN